MRSWHDGEESRTTVLHANIVSATGIMTPIHLGAQREAVLPTNRLKLGLGFHRRWLSFAWP